MKSTLFTSAVILMMFFGPIKSHLFAHSTPSPKPFSLAEIASNIEPKSTKLLTSYSLEAYLPEIGNQGDLGSCVGWATTYYAFTMVKRIEHGKDYPVFSPLSTYNRYCYMDKKPALQGGAHFIPCLNLLVKKGSPTVNDYNLPYGAMDADKTTYQDRLNGYEELQTNNAEQIKNAIIQNRPVVIGIKVQKNSLGYSLSPNFLTSQGVIEMDAFLQSNRSGLHAMVIVAYNDTLDGGSFKLVNSYGKEWGDKGFCWIRYRDIGYLSDAFALIPGESHAEKAKEIKPLFKTQQITLYNAGKKPCYLAYGFEQGGEISIHGWYIIEAGKELNLNIANRTTNELHYAIMNDKGMVNASQSKNGRTFSINRYGAFETNGLPKESEDQVRFNLLIPNNDKKSEFFNIANDYSPRIYALNP